VIAPYMDSARTSFNGTETALQRRCNGAATAGLAR
jgi:hypothetical protein